MERYTLNGGVLTAVYSIEGDSLLGTSEFVGTTSPKKTNQYSTRSNHQHE